MNHKVLHCSIYLSWIILVVCCIIKVFGGNWFTLNHTSTWLEEHVLAQIFISIATNYILFNLYYLAICQKVHFNWWIHLALFIYFIAIILIKIFLIPTNLYFVLDLISNFIVPALLVFKCIGRPIHKHKRDYFRIIIAFCLNCGFQSISVIVRDVSVDVVVTNLLVQLVMTIGVFIMLVIYWLYSLYYKKEVNDMGLFFTFLLGKNKDELEALLKETDEKLEKNPNDEKLKEEKEAIKNALGNL